MKYAISTLAINEPYESNAINFFKTLRENTTEGNFFITTANNEMGDLGEKIYVNPLNYPFITSYGNGYNFLFNLKCLSLKHIVEYEKMFPEVHHDFIIYVDSDWGMHKDFKEEKLFKLFQEMEQLNIDCVFERPAPIGPNKKNIKESFFANKIYAYDIFEYDRWDEGHCVNEQFLVFRNNSKFKFFVQRWEQFLWYTVVNNISNYAEGFEIGVSILEAGMNCEYTGIFRHCLPGCFYFHTASGNYLEKF